MPQVNLTELAKASGGTRRRQEPEAPSTVENAVRQKSRQGRKAITVQQPEEVRRQLKMLALEQGDTLENKVAEALNDLFAKYQKPEIALINKRRDHAA